MLMIENFCRHCGIKISIAATYCSVAHKEAWRTKRDQDRNRGQKQRLTELPNTPAVAIRHTIDDGVIGEVRVAVPTPPVGLWGVQWS
jgi:hypothetical protein